MMRALALAAALAGVSAQAAQADCNGDAAPCAIEGGTYHVVLPENAAGGAPAVLLLHGWGGEGVGFVRNSGIAAVMLARGYAVIAPDGLPRTQGNGRTWSFRPGEVMRRDEAAFLMAVADDAAGRFDLDRARMVLAGFSIGGSMVSYVACSAPEAFSAYAPIAGSFWRPHPVVCAAPVRLLHTHGTADRTVPLEGREVGSGLMQGNVFEAMEIWRATLGCTGDATAEPEVRGIYSVAQWHDCAPGGQLDFALHAGAHGIPRGWADLMLNWYEAE